MKKILWIAMLWAAVGCAASQHEGSMPDGEAQKSLEAYVRDVFAHFGKGDFAYLKQSMCHEAIVFDLDENGQPIERRGEAEVGALLDHYQETMKQPGMGTSATIQRIDCDRHGMFCAVEFDQTFTMNGVTTQPMKYRATIVAKHHGDKWIWTHWHASLREIPPPPPQGPPPPVPGA